MFSGQHGNLHLIRDGYMYSRHMNYKDKVYWRCRQYVNGCKVRLTTCGNKLQSVSASHQHPPEGSFSKDDLNLTRSADNNSQDAASILALQYKWASEARLNTQNFH